MGLDVFLPVGANDFFALHFGFLARTHAFFHAAFVPTAGFRIHATIKNALQFRCEFLVFRFVFVHN